MITVKSVNQLKLGDIISHIHMNRASLTDVDYVFQNFVCRECMLVERERCDDYTQYKFLIIESDCKYTDGTYIYLQYFDESSKIICLYNVKEIIGCHSATHH